MHDRTIRVLFWLACLYDGGLGALFLAAPRWAFNACGTPLPNHLGYVQFPAALLLVFGLMFATVALQPRAHRDLIVYGVLLKFSYSSIALAYWAAEGIPFMFKPFAIIDLVFLVLFLWAYGSIGSTTEGRER
jgi:hypothetical protein